MPSARAATRSPLVLMADAHEWFSRALESVLVPGGYSVVKAYTATGVLQQLKLTEPDALILAVDLPGGEGLNLCRMLRADSLVTPSTPIILTQPTPSTRRQTLAALRAGAAELWGQRLDAEELLLRLAAQNRAKADADRAWAEGLVDHATQLYNGRGIARRARELGAEARRRSAPLACVAFAVDAGEAEGPSAETVARGLRETGRTSDALGRIGPREFVVLAPETSAEAAHHLAERLAGALSARRRRRIGPGVEFLAGYDAGPDAAAPKFDPAPLLAHASAALAAGRTPPLPPVDSATRSSIRVAVVDDERTLRESCHSVLQAEGYNVALCGRGNEARETLKRRPFDIALVDWFMGEVPGSELLQTALATHPGTIVIIMTGNPSVASSLEALQAGAWDYLPKPFSGTQLQILIGRAAHAVLVARESRVLEEQRAQHPGDGDRIPVLGDSPLFQKAIALARKVAATDASVFLTGESGAGKELFAQFIHDNSRRSSRSLVAVNCAALPEPLLESEMFGHCKGAFTGAVRDKPGLLKTANGGTLFLDERSEEHTSELQS